MSFLSNLIFLPCLEKERKNYLQRNHDLDLVVTKLNKDNEYLNNELGEKNGLISG